jgi:hypothetical protein
LKIYLLAGAIVLICIAIIVVDPAVVFFHSPGAFPKYSALKLKLCRLTGKIVSGRRGWLFFQPELEFLDTKLCLDNIPRIAAFNNTLKAIGITLFVVPIPNKIEIYPDNFSSLPLPNPLKTDREEYMRTLENAGVRVIDLMPAFQHARDSCPVFRRFDTHWTPQGIEVAAQAIAKRIDSTLIKKGIRRDVVCLTKDTLICAYGDLYDKKRLKWWYKPDTLRVKQVLNPDGTGLGDDQPSQVLILGDSYVDYARWWKTKLGSHIARCTGVPTRTYFTIMANWNGPCMYRPYFPGMVS